MLAHSILLQTAVHYMLSKQEHYILNLVVSYLQYVIIKCTSLTFKFTSWTHSIS